MGTAAESLPVVAAVRSLRRYVDEVINIQMPRATTAGRWSFKLWLSQFAVRIRRDDSMIRMIAVSVLLLGSGALADEQGSFALTAPKGWGGETISLPPGFAPHMKLNGVEHIRFAPGMMRPGSGSFFCYAFAFELDSKPKLTRAVVHDEFLSYYRGLCTAVLGGEVPEVDPAKFTLKLKRIESAATAPDNEKTAIRYQGALEWVEPFATKKPQKLHLEIRTWTRKGHNYLFACVSPQEKDAEIWKQLHMIRDGYLQNLKTGRTASE